jgi:hypothetical protein
MRRSHTTVGHSDYDDPGHSHPDRSMSFNNFGNAFLSSFIRSGRSWELGMAFSYHQEALSLHPPGHPDRPVSFYNSASTALACYKRLGQGCPGDLKQAITFYREALSIYAPGHPDCSAAAVAKLL